MGHHFEAGLLIEGGLDLLGMKWNVDIKAEGSDASGGALAGFHFHLGAINGQFIGQFITKVKNHRFLSCSSACVRTMRVRVLGGRSWVFTGKNEWFHTFVELSHYS